MYFLKLIDCIENKNLKKINFYIENNLFFRNYKIEEINDLASVNYFIKKILKQIFDVSENTNFLFVEDDAKWAIYTTATENANLVVINKKRVLTNYFETQISRRFDGVKEVFNYLIIMGSILITLKKTIFINPFENNNNIGENYVSAMKFLNNLITTSDYIFEKKEYCKKITNFFVMSSDSSIEKIMSYGKKFAFSIVFLFFENRITLEEASELIDFDNKDKCLEFLNNYEKVSRIFYLKEKGFK
ncbi:hypothetical protein [Campylobacter sp. US33a]|uniref:hypothetical protein n=1 Tax=Campylobacter sp. US33a TaxID=2498120 RepID=UPI001067FBA8|nr:hypothetical protein [Campylobacter sp. US33a]TEY00709.1 hypothetical protein ELQ16_08730 [Campylobacter sp. US33a]